MLIPGARKGDSLGDFSDDVKNASAFCGQEKGLGTKKDGSVGPSTICSKSFCTNVQAYVDN